MDAIKGHKVMTCKISGVFLQADWPKDNGCYLKVEGLMVKIIYKIGPSYKKCVLIMEISPRLYTEPSYEQYYFTTN